MRRPRTRKAMLRWAFWLVVAGLILLPTAIVWFGGSPGGAVVLGGVLGFLVASGYFAHLGYVDGRRQGRSVARSVASGVRAIGTFWWELAGLGD